MKTTQAQLAHRREIHAEAIAKAEEMTYEEAVRLSELRGMLAKPRRGRPPLPLDQRTRKRNYSIRLNPEHIAELQKRGTKALEAWLES